ncbi:MAG TPA: ABC transporter substrate-binding protein, partial [Gemmatimonadaceae bacterium]
GHIFLALNPTDPKNRKSPHPIFSDRRVRRALAMSVDRAAMLKNVFGDHGKLGRGPFPSNAFFADSSMHALPYDTTAAKAMLDSSGWRVGPDGMRAKSGRPMRFTISVHSSPQRQRYAVMMQEQLKKLGVGVDIDRIDFGALMAHQDKRDFDATMSSFTPDPSPSGLRQAWGSEGIGGQNFLGYSNKQFDALLDSATSSFDPVKTKEYASRAFQIVNDDAPAIFLYDIVLLEGVHRRVTTANMRPDEWWANLADWSIPPDKRIERDRIGLAAAKP